MRQKLRGNAGFTLTELIVTAVILGFLLLGFVSFTIISSRSQQRSVGDMLLQSNQRYITSLFKNAVRPATYVVIANAPTNSKFEVKDAGLVVIGGFWIKTATTYSYRLPGEAAWIPDRSLQNGVQFSGATPFDTLGGAKELKYSFALTAATTAFGNVSQKVEGRVRCRN